MRFVRRLISSRLNPFVLALLVSSTPPVTADDPAASGLSFAQLAAVREVVEVAIAPDGDAVAYVLRVPRRPGVDEDGPPWQELHLVGAGGGPSRAYVHGEVGVSEPQFTPDGRYLLYRAKRGGDERPAIWAIPVAGGESFRVLAHDAEIRTFRLSPAGTHLAFVAPEAESEAREEAAKKGFDQEVFEEDWRPLRAWIADLPPLPPPPPVPGADGGAPPAPRALELEGSVRELEWSPDGSRLLLTLMPRPLVDDGYMFRRLHLVDAAGGEVLARFDNPGKLGDFAVAPGGEHVAMVSAADPNDPKEGRLLVAPAAGGELRDLLPDFEGHVSHLAWRDRRTVLYVADVGVETVIGEVDLDGSGDVLLRSGGGPQAPVVTGLALSRDGARAALIGETPRHPREAWSFAPGQPPRRLSDSNPWLGGVTLAEQRTHRYAARDGLELDGILLEPPAGDGPAPLILMVHGGPESHVRNGWVTSYSRPAQLAAGRGYAVFLPNYRGSTGRGVAFSKLGQGDAAGPEFDDLIDAIDALAAAGVADPQRVGVTGGSYGGYATAWLATRYSERIRAGVMFVGISNKMSKALTTDIPVEDMMVHTLYEPWTRFDFALERSPLSYAARCRTPLLIAGGTDDTRVHPSQSLQLYRALKLIGQAPVRLVRYPGEGHGNRRAAARDDYARRLMRWMDHFLLADNHQPPPWELERDD
ncbi:MAG: S9 family peptidase [Acidobacteria bacterium]|nr:MAG: S9 family peptidase [Acidobacteriota bacterium]